MASMISTRLLSMAIPPSDQTTHLLFFDNKPRTSSIRSCSNFRFKAQTRDDHISSHERRSGNYKPPIWNFDFIHSLSNDFNKEERYLKRASKLMGEVKMILDIDEQGMDHVIERLELIDDLQRLGISYHFKDKIERILNSIYHEEYNYPNDDLHSTSLRFRLLRQHGFSVSQDVFDRFKNDEGDDFDASLSNDTRGLLQLYEASFMLTEGEDTLELARMFATKFLEKNVCDDDEYLSLLVGKALDIPLHWRIPKLNARWFIFAYEKRSKNMNPIVLELAKLDFNIVQAKHQEELRHVSSWWEESRLAKQLPFARDMLVQYYFFAFFVHLEPRYGYSRIMATKFNALVTIIDDMFDVYATVEELKLFVDAVKSWDMEAMEKLPNFMQTCFLSLNNFINEMAYDVHKEQGLLIIPHLRKSWEDLLQTYLREAELYSKRVTPKFGDYMSNACSSSSAIVLLSHAYFLVANPIEHKAVEGLHNCHNIIRYSGLILRLANDLGTSADEMDRGDVPKSIQCYMNETGASVDEAREHVRVLIYETWKKLNGETSPPFMTEFVRIVADLGRMALYVYKHENSPGIQYAHMIDNISSFLFEPIDV